MSMNMKRGLLSPILPLLLFAALAAAEIPPNLVMFFLPLVLIWYKIYMNPFLPLFDELGEPKGEANLLLILG